MQNEEKIKEYIKKFTFDFEKGWSRSQEVTLKRCEDQYLQELQRGGCVDDMVSIVGEIKNKKILEIGSGAGGLSVGAALRGAIVYGIEPHKYGIYASTLRSKRYDNIKSNFISAIAENLCFKDNTFDLVFSNQVLEHVQNMDNVITEMHRVLKKGGSVYLRLPNNLWPYEGHYQIFWPPLLPKIIGKYYAKLRSKNPYGITTIRYIIPFALEYKLKKGGFADIKNHSAENYLEKFNMPEKLARPTLSKILKILEFLKLNLLLGRLVIKLGFYPSLELSATKRS